MHDEIAPRAIPSEKSLFVVDIRDFSKIPESHMPLIRQDLGDIMTRVFARSGLAEDWEDKLSRDTGDGAIFALPPNRMAWLLDPLLGNLNQELIRYNKGQPRSMPAIWLRVSIDVGPLPPEDPSDASVNACRLVNSDLAYAGMTAAIEHGSYVATVVSQTVFKRTVDADRLELLSESDFLSSTPQVAGKPSFNQLNELAYIHVPGVRPASIEPHLARHSAGHQHTGASHTASTPHPSVSSTQPSAAPKFQFNASVGTVADHIGTIYQPISFPAPQADS
ncbi:hypothetical protein ACFFKE_09265 [Streptomyces mutabilis]|uniref:hypothetical protein n=1 Tax=Streptomyces mutabilis TaxID=67332 RepID=UPI001783CB2E|nr:hypothetical protein [Streptomyces mutabilis]GGQ23532.1 hypothetical protein GCM10010279_34130 [Streptomyces mutabilis]